jgi:hypothetical protein
MIVWFVAGIGIGALLFFAGFGWGQAWEQRKKLDRAFTLTHWPHSDYAARRAVEGDEDYEPDAPGRWPISPWMGGGRSRSLGVAGRRHGSAGLGMAW